MSELDDILNSIPKQYDTKFVSFDDIKSLHPTFDKKNIATYHLYLSYNNHILTEAEKDKVREIIHRLKYQENTINTQNLEYMSRHLKQENNVLLNRLKEPKKI